MIPLYACVYKRVCVWFSYVCVYMCVCVSDWKWKSLSCVWLCDPKDYRVRGILQARILGWVAVPSSRGSSQPRDWTQVSHIVADSLPSAGVHLHLCFPGSSDNKESACNAGDPGWIPGLGRSPGGGNGNPLQYSSLENPISRGAWQPIVHGVTKSQMLLSN